MKKIVKDLQQKSVKELQKEVVKLKKEIDELILSFQTNPQKDTNSISHKKKKVSVLLTVLSQKKEDDLIKVGQKIK